MIEHMDDGYGWCGRVGFITPASVLETPLYELFLMAPPGIAFVSAHMNVRTVDVSSLAAARQLLAATAMEVGRYKIDYLIVAGNPLAYRTEDAGRASAELTSAAESSAGVEAAFEWQLTVDALRAVGVEHLAVASPFGPTANAGLTAALESEGFHVGAVEAAGLGSNAEITLEPLRTAYRLATRAYRSYPRADAVYITCPRWPVAPCLSLLEDELGVPVIASVATLLRGALRGLGLHRPVEGYGTLLSEHL